MKSKSLAIALAFTAVAGCSLKRELNKVGANIYPGSQQASGGQLIQPKMCKLTVAIIPQPLSDPSINSGLWNSADEQAIGPEARRVIEANGLRVGIITGGIPAALEAAMNAPPPKKVDPSEFILPDGSNTMIALGETRQTASLLLNREGRAFGKDYKEASGWFRVTASQDGSTGVSLRFTPEIRYGPISRRFDGSGVHATTPMEFQFKDGQQEETLRDLAATLVLEPGQVAVLGCITERKGSLGSFMFTHPEENSDRLVQKVLVIWATRSNLGEPGSQPQPKPAAILKPVKPPELTPGSRVAEAILGKDDKKSVVPESSP